MENPTTEGITDQIPKTAEESRGMASSAAAQVLNSNLCIDITDF